MTSCPDCPDIGGDRARCCRDEHIDRRLAGAIDGWSDVLTARGASADDEARKSRQVRRAEERARAKAGR